MAVDILTALTSVVPLTISGVISLLIQVFIGFVVIIFVDKLIAHEIEAKHAIIMSVGAYFIAPIFLSILSIVGIVIPFGFVIIPLIVWIILGEILLEADFKSKFIVTVIAFSIYFVLIHLIGLPGIVSGFIKIG